MKVKCIYRPLHSSKFFSISQKIIPVISYPHYAQVMHTLVYFNLLLIKILC